MRENVWYNLRVPKTLEKKNENFSLKMPVTLMRRLAEIAEFEDRPLGYVGRELMIRGLALYELDGRLRDDRPGVRSAEINLAPVVARIGPGESTSKEDVQRMINESETGKRKAG